MEVPADGNIGRFESCNNYLDWDKHMKRVSRAYKFSYNDESLHPRPARRKDVSQL